MRIISGKYRKKQIFPPSNFNARPTTDTAKEAIFNVIANAFDIDDSEVLDLFSGTGNISYEFASRDCKSIEAVEMRFQHYQFIKKTITELKFHQMKVIKANVFSYIKNTSNQYDIIFADPPYNLNKLDTIPDLIFDNCLLKKGGWLILEHNENYTFEDHPNFVEMRNYSKVHFSIFENK
jgi:16S rRNA (guanine966-N2)-methyltransferase